MMNLVRAELHRYRRSMLFWGAVLVSFFAGIWSGHVSATISYGGNFQGSFEAIYYIPLFVVLGIFTAFTIGREYSDGVIRNKVIIGNTRSEIFLSKLLVSFLVSAMFTTAFLVAYLIQTGSVMAGYLPFSIAAKAILSLYLVSGVWAALFSTVSLLISRQEVSVLVNLAFVLAVFFSSIGIGDSLMQPAEIANNVTVEMTPEEVEQYKNGEWEEFSSLFTDANGVTSYYKREQQGMIPNPNYPTGMVREAMEIVESALPYGQVLLYTDYLTACLWSDSPESIPTYDVQFLPLYALAAMALVSCAGLSLFRKKELR